jgi:hypothetical protein
MVHGWIPRARDLGSWGRAQLLRPPGRRDGLLYRWSRRGDRLCIPAAGELRRSVLTELHATLFRGPLLPRHNPGYESRPPVRVVAGAACGSR